MRKLATLAFAVFYLMVIVPLLTGLIRSGTAHSAPIATRAEQLVGWREGTARLNRLLHINTRIVPWCAAFARYLSPRNPSISVRGRDVASSGRIVQKPQRGDWAFWHHSHMGVVTNVKRIARTTMVCTVSGNRRNQVARACEPLSHFRRFRRPN